MRTFIIFFIVIFIPFGVSVKTDCKVRLQQCENRKPAPRKPVCGTDNRTYPNRCALLRVQCMHNVPLTVKHKGKCKERQPCWIDQAKKLNKNNGKEQVLNDYIPECLPDGTYAPVQCQKSLGYCWCVTPNGKMILRTMTARHRKLECPKRGKVNTSTDDNGNSSKKGCDHTDKSTFVNNLVRIFKTEYNRDVFSKQYDFPIIQNMSRLEENAIQWKFVTLDKDKNHSLNKNEYRDLRKLIKKVVKPRRCSRAFVRLCDMDHDSIISKNEWMSCLNIKNNDDHSRPYSEDTVAVDVHNNFGEVDIPEPDSDLTTGFGSEVSMLPLNDRSPNSEKEPEDKLNDCPSDRKAVLDELKLGTQEIYIPECMPDGRYKKVQCYPSTGYCWCVLEDSGKPIAGTSVRDSSPKCDFIQQLPRPMKGCPDHKKITFIKDLMAFFDKNLTVAEPNEAEEEEQEQEQGEEIIRRNQKGHEQLAILAFHSLDANKNEILDRKEWKYFRAMMATSKTMKRCGRKLPRYCDTNHDNKITKSEWIQCLSLQIVPSSISRDVGLHSNTTDSKRRGPNPIESVLKDD